MLQCKFFFVLVWSLFSTLCHAEWTTSQPLLISETYSYTYASVFTSCDSTRGVFLAAWANGNNNQYPTYSFFTTDTGWSAIDIISNSSQAVVTSNICTSCDQQSGKFIATWTDSSTFYPTSSVYTPGTGWGAANPLTTSTAAKNTASSLNSNTGQLLITWADTNNNFPTCAFYTPNVGSWGVPETITTNSRTANVYTSFDSETNQFLAVLHDPAE